MQKYRYIRIITRAVILLLIFSASTIASWKKVAQLPEPICCCFFLDPNHGFAGTGAYGLNLTLEIWLTTNGGVSWTQATVPQSDGEVTQIAVNPDGTGYASIFSEQHPTVNLWKTTDGGYSWKDISSGFHFGAGVGFDGHTAYWNDPFIPGKDSNGVYTMNGGKTIVTPGPNSQFGEAWSAYGDSAHNIWYMVTEQSRVLYISTDGANTWKKRHQFGADLPLGGLPVNIFGYGDKLYVQTEKNGILRGTTADSGATWVALPLSPSNEADSRTIFVSGCAGQNILAFDNAGGLWESPDGGDGGVNVASNITIQHAKFLSISSCSNLTKKATFVTQGCMPYVISNYSLVNNAAGVYTIVNATKKKNLATVPLTIPDTLEAGDSVTFTINFNPHYQVGAYNALVKVTGYFEAGFGNPQVEADSNIQVTGASQAVPPKVQANLTEIDFGDVSICGGEADSTFTIQNVGCDTMQIVSGPGPLDPAFTFDNITLPYTLPPDSTIVIHVRFKPTHAGLITSVSPYPEFDVTAQGITDKIQFTLMGTGIAGVGVLSTGIQLFSFDTLSICSTADSVSGYFTNVGCGPIVIDSYSENGNPDFTMRGISQGLEILPGDTLRYTITFLPQAKGMRTKNFIAIVKDKNGVGSPKTVSISSRAFVTHGTYIIAASLDNINFGTTTLCNNPPDSSVIFYNKGCDTLEITAAQMSGSGFQVSGVTFPIFIAPGSSASITIHPYLDTTAGKTVMTGSLTVSSNATNTVITPITFTRSVTPHREVGLYLDASAKRGTDQNVVTFEIKETPGKTFTGAAIKQITFDIIHNSDLLEFIPGQSSGNGISGTPNGNSFTLSNSAITADANGVLATLAFRVYLTKDSTTNLALANVQLGGIDTSAGACPTTLSYSGSASFGYDFACGERSIQGWMNGVMPMRIISLRPNPAQDELKLNVFSSSMQEANIEILDALGKSFTTYMSYMTYGTNVISIDTRNLSQGIYILRIGGVSQSFIKVK